MLIKMVAPIIIITRDAGVNFIGASVASFLSNMAPKRDGSVRASNLMGVEFVATTSFLSIMGDKLMEAA